MLENNLPSEIASKINLVDLAGSSGAGPSQRQSYIPYRDSVLTWLLKDSLGGNSRTIMVATVSPAHTSYSETMSTLRYASNAKNITNKPRVNEDANVKLIRELREEIGRLKAMLLSFELIDQLSKDWARKWNEWKALVEHYRVDINRRRAGLVIDSSLPHLMALEDDVLSTGVVLYHLKEGTTKIGRIDSDQEQDIVLQGQWIERDHCTITSACGVVILRPARGARCTVNGREVTASCRLTQGAVITLGKAQKFRFNHPAEAAVLRQRRQVGETVGDSGSLEWLDLDGDVTASRLGLCPLLGKERPGALLAAEDSLGADLSGEMLDGDRSALRRGSSSGSLWAGPVLPSYHCQHACASPWQQRVVWAQASERAEGPGEKQPAAVFPRAHSHRKALGEQSGKDHRPPRAGETPCGAQIQQRRLCFVGDLRQRILAGQIRAKQERELDGTCASQQVKDDQQWLLREGTWPAGLQQQQLQQDRVEEKELAAAVPSDSWCQTDPETQPSPLVQSQKRVVHPQLLRRLALRVAEQNGRQRRVSFQLERIIEKPRLLEAHRRPEQLRALCWLQDDCPRRPTFPAPCPGALVPGLQRRSRLTSCSSLSLRRPCSRHSAQLRSVFLNWDPSTTLPPMPDPTEQLSEKTPSEEYLPQAAYYPPRTGHFIKHALRSSGEGQLCTARKALARKGASPPGTCLTESCESASVQEMERVALLEPRKLEEPQGKERDLPEPDDSDSEDSQISEDSLAEKGYQSPQDSPGLSYLTHGRGHSRARAQASVRGFTTPSDSRLFTQTHRSFSLDSLIDAEEELGDDRQEEPFLHSADEMPTETFWRLQSSSLPAGDQEAVCRPGPISHRTGARLDATLPVSSSCYLELQPRCEQPELAVEASSAEQANTLQDGPGQPSSGGEQPAPRHQCSLPVIAIVSGPKHSRPQFSVVSSPRSLQELSLSVEPPSPTDEDIQEPSRLWTPHPRGSSSGKSAARTSLKAEGCDQEDSSDLDGIAADPRPPPSTPAPYPATSALSCMPTPALMAAWPFGTPEQAQPGKPERLGGQARPEAQRSEAGGGALLFSPSAIDPCVLPGRPEGPARVGWKQYVFGGAADVSRGSTPQGLTPSDVDRCSHEDDGLDDQGSPVYSHRSTLASAQGLSSTCSHIESARCSREAWGVWGSSFALGSPHVLISSEGAAPPKGPGERGGFPGTPDEAGCLRREPPLAGGSAAGPVDEIMLLYPSEAGGPVGVSRMNTLEQGTQTLGCRSRWSYADLSSAQSDLASWASMHDLSLRLSQLLHSTSELLGSLSQPSVAKKERNAKREAPGEVPQALRMDGYTQTTMDEGIQTDPASPPLHLQAPEANPQKVNAVLERLGSDLSITSQEKGDVPGTLKKRGAEGTARKIAGPQDLEEGNTLCRPRSAPVPSSHLSFQKVPSGQNLPPLSPQASPDAPLPPSLAGGSPGCSLSASPSPGPCPHAVEPVEEPGVQKERGPTSALRVDRASSPILTLSASTQGSGRPSGALSLSAPSAHSLEGCQKLVSRPSLPLGARRPAVGNYSQTPDESGSSQRMEALCGEGSSPLEGGDHRCSLGLSSRGHPEQSAKPQVCCVEQAPQQRQPRTTTGAQGRLSPPPPGSRSRRLADGFVPEDVASLECGPLSSRGLSRWQCRTENGGEGSASPEEPRPALNISSSWGGLRRRRPCPFFELADPSGLRGCILGPTEACQPEGPLRPSSQMCTAPEPRHHGLRDLPVYNKSSDWCGGQDGSPGALGVMDLLGTRCDCSSGEQGQRPPRPPEDQSQAPEWSQREQIPLRVGAQTLSLSVELTEAKLHHGFGEADALLQMLQSGTGEALAAQEEEPYARPERTTHSLRRERAERLQNFRRTRSLSPQKQLSFPSNRDLPTWAFDLPSRRREYLQQLRKDVVETTRSPGSASRSPHPPSDIELMLREYQRAREEAKVEIARARARLREQTEQEKLRIRQQIVSQLLREEEKLHTLAASSSWCTSSNGSLSSGVTSGYNSSPALPGQLQSPDSVVSRQMQA
ncbi:hypothetical protein J1605_015067 [Eschrichtius robustus]|uniref:Kinesin motor domain-containing protein n=1 Tax=Eschrichtius robustus TaxID=9764 RepID=A0AB34GDL3_ESCRO|nr:hypothetical protein J1605_015067 [Eschrichtius robustus]